MTTTLLPGVLRLGSIRVSLFGVYAAAGVIAALWLSQRSARLAGVDVHALWDAGLFLVVTGFVISRSMLIAGDPRAFARYPLLVLALPSYTVLDALLTAAAMLAYLAWARLPMLRVLDAWSPCAAVLAAALAAAHWADGSDAGMPTGLSWGVISPRTPAMGRLQPVQMYLLGAAIAVGLTAWRLLARPHAAGAVVAWTLLTGGLLCFALDMLAQPQDPLSTALLDPVQWEALGCCAVGLGLYSRQAFASLSAHEGIS